MDIRGWDNESSRSVATVTWAIGSTNVYRLGYKGCVDLCYVEEATAGTYYKEHLPLLGQPVIVYPDGRNDSISNRGNTQNVVVSSLRHLTFNIGDKVKVLIQVEALKEMQDGHGGWNPRMAEYIGKVLGGIIKSNYIELHRIDRFNCIRVTCRLMHRYRSVQFIALRTREIFAYNTRVVTTDGHFTPRL